MKRALTIAVMAALVAAPAVGWFSALTVMNLRGRTTGGPVRPL